VQVFNSAGKSLEIITVPEQAYNVTFGGAEQSTLFIAAESSVYAVQMKTMGHQAISKPGGRGCCRAETPAQCGSAGASPSRAPVLKLVHVFPARGQEHSRGVTK
jgi:hypothetical protein